MSARPPVIRAGILAKTPTVAGSSTQAVRVVPLKPLRRPDIKHTARAWGVHVSIVLTKVWKVLCNRPNRCVYFAHNARKAKWYTTSRTMADVSRNRSANALRFFLFFTKVKAQQESSHSGHATS
eukprot:11187907-Lingulodinium_polyedra.AAC.1